MNRSTSRSGKLSKTYPDARRGRRSSSRTSTSTLAEGEFVCLIGHSGCGKSTVLSMVAGPAADVSGGVIVLAGKRDRRARARPRRRVPGAVPAALDDRARERACSASTRSIRRRAARERRRDRRRTTSTLVGLGDAHAQEAGRAVGGHAPARRPRARLRARSPKMLLLDEPFGMLDSLTRFELQEVLLDIWAADQKTALMVTHDVDEALFLSDRIAMMTNGPAAKLGGIVQVPFPRPATRGGARAPRLLRPARAAHRVPRRTGPPTGPPDAADRGRFLGMAESLLIVHVHVHVKPDAVDGVPRRHARQRARERARARHRPLRRRPVARGPDALRARRGLPDADGARRAQGDRALPDAGATPCAD